jgi:hypothetical protein
MYLYHASCVEDTGEQGMCSAIVRGERKGGRIRSLWHYRYLFLSRALVRRRADNGGVGDRHGVVSWMAL